MVVDARSKYGGRLPGLGNCTIAKNTFQVVEYVSVVTVNMGFNGPVFSIRCCEGGTVLDVSQTAYFAFIWIAFCENTWQLISVGDGCCYYGTENVLWLTNCFNESNILEHFFYMVRTCIYQ